MKVVEGDIWEVGANFMVITTNGTLRKDGACVMGRGTALQAKQRFPGIEYHLGKALRTDGNKVTVLFKEGKGHNIVAFPVKHNWWEKADLKLIKQSVIELKALAEGANSTFALPIPGIGNGGRTLEEVLPILEEANLPDNVILVARKENT